MFVCVCVCVHAASVTSFLPVTVLATNAAPVVTISGLGLDVPSVRAVRFEPSATCTLLAASPTFGTVNGANIAAGGVSQFAITVTQNATFAPAAYSVCIDYVANASGGAFAKVGSVQLLVGLTFSLMYMYS